MVAMFQRRCGERVTLTNGNKTATRNFAEFNYGLVLSSEPLVDNQLFEVRIDKKINSWSGSLEIGVTACEPSSLEFNSSATDLRDGSWVLSGNSILKDGRPILDVYGIDLNKLAEGDRVGVMRTSQGELVFWVNGLSHGVAATGIPTQVHAVVDLFGKCAQVTLLSNDGPSDESCAVPDSLTVNNLSLTNGVVVTPVRTNILVTSSFDGTGMTRGGGTVSLVERLRFFDRTGQLVRLTNGGRTAERRRPMDDFNNGVVMTHRPLKDNELFEIRIDRLVEKWSGSIEVGITTHDPSLLEFPATMTNLRTGTTMMSGCGILTNGKGTRREYGEFNLDELREGDRIAMMRKSNGSLHYFINGLDQGIAATKVPQKVWGVVDLYGMTVKVTIVDRDEREEQNLITRRNTVLRDQQLNGLIDTPDDDYVERLMFHQNCGTHAAVINNGRTAHRPNAADDFNNGVVLTNRPLKHNELFEVRLDKMVTKWAGSIEIGVTTHSPTDLEYPSTMTNVRSGTWMMTGNGVMHNGTTVIDEYGQNLDRLQVGDRVGVMRRDTGTLHFFVNGIDQGPAASNIPEATYGVIDLYGQAAQATIIDPSSPFSSSAAVHSILYSSAFPGQFPASSVSQYGQSANIPASYQHGLHSPADTVRSGFSNAALYSDLRFHHVHGKNARVSNNGLTASRPRAFGEFNDAIVISNRALREGEMFEVVIEKMVDRWSGSIEAGVTAIKPDNLDFPCTMTDIDHDTWMLSGSSVMQDGVTVRNGYRCDLDSLEVGSRIGMMRHVDGSLHYYVNGEDQGMACESIPPHIYAVIDLYGQCAQVSIINYQHGQENSVASSHPMASSHLSLPLITEITHRFSSCHGKNIVLRDENTTATRVRSFNNGLVFSATPLEPEELFEIQIKEVASQWSGSLQIGVVTFVPYSNSSEPVVPNNLPASIGGLSAETWYIQGSEVKHNGSTLHYNFCPDLDWVAPGDRVGLKCCADKSLRFFLNSEDLGVAATNINKPIYAVIDLYGSTESVSITSSVRPHHTHHPHHMLPHPLGVHNGIVRQHPVPGALQGIHQQGGPVSHSSFPFASVSPSTLPSGRDDDEDEEEEAVAVPPDPTTIPGPAPQPGIDDLSPATTASTSSSLRIHEDPCSPVGANGLIGAGPASSKPSVLPPSEFHEKHGRNIQLGEGKRSAKRIASYNQGVLVSGRPLPRGHIFQVRIDKLNSRWTSSLLCGITCLSPDRIKFPLNALGFKRNSWIVCEDSVFQNGSKVKGRYGPNLDSLEVGRKLGLMVDSEGKLHLFVDGVDQGIAAVEIPPSPVYAVLDLYGQCEEVTIMSPETEEAPLARMEGEAMEEDEKDRLVIESEFPREKADLEREEKEKSANRCSAGSSSSSVTGTSSMGVTATITSYSSIPATIVQNCDYKNACVRFKSLLGLPDAYFAPDRRKGTCHCESCYKVLRDVVNGQGPSISKIDPLAEHALPVGWCEFPLRLPARSSSPSSTPIASQSSIAPSSSVPTISTTALSPYTSTTSGAGDNSSSTAPMEKWHIAYHGTRAGAVRQILDHGELLLPGELGLEGSLIRKLKSKEEDSDGSQLVFSPSIKYAGLSAFASKYEFMDPKTKQLSQGQVVLRVLVQPGSYKVGPPSISLSGIIDPKLEHDAIEWVTKERGAAIPSALLVCLSPTPGA
ncbi:neuralized-like protein 4 [Hetaerina americana]|uniref:neuralized-like protein 4 n=1 Tax=Hetaerina americana TaxID=62018 RepID=UPI003A7F1836